MSDTFWDLPDIRNKQQLLLMELEKQCAVLEKLCVAIEELAEVIKSVCEVKSE